MAFPGTALGAGQSGNVILIGEAGHGIVGLRLEHAAHEPALGVNPEYRQRIFPPPHGWARCLGQMLDKRGDEDRLTRPRQSGDPEANMRARRQLDEGLRCGAGFEQEVGDKRQSRLAFQSISWRRGARERAGKTGKANEP